MKDQSNEKLNQGDSGVTQWDSDGMLRKECFEVVNNFTEVDLKTRNNEAKETWSDDTTTWSKSTPPKQGVRV